MSTRSIIGFYENGSVSFTYHHYDGYFDWMGVILSRHFNEVEKVREMVCNGDYVKFSKDGSYEQRVDFPDRKMQFEAKNLRDAMEQAIKHDFCDEEYIYIFNAHNGKWSCCSKNQYGYEKKFELYYNRIPAPVNDYFAD